MDNIIIITIYDYSIVVDTWLNYEGICRVVDVRNTFVTYNICMQ